MAFEPLTTPGYERNTSTRSGNQTSYYSTLPDCKKLIRQEVKKETPRLRALQLASRQIVIPRIPDDKKISPNKQTVITQVPTGNKNTPWKSISRTEATWTVSTRYQLFLQLPPGQAVITRLPDGNPDSISRTAGLYSLHQKVDLKLPYRQKLITRRLDSNQSNRQLSDGRIDYSYKQTVTTHLLDSCKKSLSAKKATWMPNRMLPQTIKR